MTMHRQDCLKSIPAITMLPTISAGIQMTLPAQINAKLHQGRLSLSGTRVNVVVSIEKLDITAEGGFDFGTTVVKGEDGRNYLIDFKNENLILRDEKGDTIMTAPEGIGMIDMDTLMPLTNADTKVGMKVLVTMTPAHPNWWDADRKPYECWLPELKKVGMKGDQVRY